MADVIGVVAVRDSKDAASPVLTFTPAAWADFIRSTGRR
ncbi:DUF397 domain-containing protein [Micromonospora sp. CPCC 206060]